MANGIEPIPISPQDLINLVRRIAQNSANIVVPEFLKKEKWEPRITLLQVYKCLKDTGTIEGEVILDEYSNWVCWFSDFSAGIPLSVKVAVDPKYYDIGRVIVLEVKRGEP